MIPGLKRVRWRLAGWYLAVFSLILVALGAGLLTALRRELDRELDQELLSRVADLEHEVDMRVAEGYPDDDAARLGLEALTSPVHPLAIIGSNGASLGIDDSVSDDVERAAMTAISRGAVRTQFRGVADQEWRVQGRRSDVLSAPVAILALADLAEMRAQQARRSEIFAGFALLAVALVGLGGAQLTRISLQPISAAFDQRRRFLAEVAHELRTPLSLLRGTLEPAIRRPRDPDQDAATLRRADAMAVRLGRLVDHLFLLARVDAGEWPVQLVDVFLDDIVSDACTAFSGAAAERGISLCLTEFAEAPVRGDPALLWQLAAVLLDNALKFTAPGGSVVVRVRTDNGRATLSVSDTGSGIEPDELPFIFQRFHRTPAARAATSGAGLGLAAAEWIATGHQATIEVRSTVGAGSTFEVVFPAAPARESL